MTPRFSAMRIDTQVAIVGAGPAGLLLSHLLSLKGVESVVIETRSRDYVEHRVRAGVLEQGTVDVLEECGAGERMRREGLVHRGIELRFDGRGHRIDFPELTGGRSIMVYGQQELVKDLVRLRLAGGGRILFEVDDVGVHDIESNAPRVRFLHGGEAVDLACRIVAGCDGFHGVCRETIPAGVLSFYERVYPFVAGDPCGCAAFIGRADLRRARSTVLLSTACVRRRSPGCTCRSRRTEISRMAGCSYLGGIAAPALVRRLHPDRGRADSGEGHYGDAQLCHRAHAVRKALSCGRCRAHRSPTGAKG